MKRLMLGWSPAAPAVVAAVAVALVIAAAPVRAMHAPPGTPWSLRAPGAGASFAFDASVGRLGATATELAFDYPRGQKLKLSELTWEATAATVAGVRASVGFGSRCVASLGAWRTLQGAEAMMVDRDWMYSGAIDAGLLDASQVTDGDWTHESRHPGATLDETTLVDLNLAVLALRRGALSLGGLVGFKLQQWEWSARGGTYVYSVDGFRDRTGTFTDAAGDDLPVIDYEQRFGVPYLGVTAAWEGKAVEAEAHLLGSVLVTAADTDYHALRDTTFTGEFSGGTFLGAGFTFAWRFLPRWRASLSAEYQLFDEITGDVTVDAPEGGASFGGGAGVALEAASVTFGASYRF